MPVKPRITDLAEFARLDAELSLQQLAKHYGCNVETVRRTRTRIGLPGRRPRMTAERKARIEQRLSEGWSHAEIARTEGVDRETIGRHFPGTAWSDEQVAKYAISARWLPPMPQEGAGDETLRGD